MNREQARRSEERKPHHPDGATIRQSAYLHKQRPGVAFFRYQLGGPAGPAPGGDMLRHWADWQKSGPGHDPAGHVRHRVRHATLVALALALGAWLVAGSFAQASASVISQDWESGLGTWTVSGDFWHVQEHPETISVLSPDINPRLVTLPDAGQLPSAHGGTHAAWFGEASTGTFCGSNFATVTQAAKEGCTSTRAYAGQLV